MSKRNHHLTDLGCIACEELSELGAGREGWLDDPAILCAIDDHSVAVANKYVILILDWSDLDEPRVKIRPDLSPIEAEHITAIEWLVLDGFRVVAVATSRGYLLIYSLSGDLIHRQMLYSGRVMKLRVRGLKEGVNQDASSGEVCAVMPGVIARVDAMDIQAMLERWFEVTSSQFWDQKSKKRDPGESGRPYGRLPYQLWNVNKYGNIVDAGITGVMPPPLLELQSSQRYFRAVTIGDDAVISAYRLSEDKSRSLVGAIFSKVVPAAFSTIASFSKMIWRSEQTPSRKSDEKLQSFAKASPLTCLKDHPRKGEKLSLSPSGTLAAITDSLGRILLLDTQALVVVRLWKGYRDANCLFFEILANRETLGSSSPDYQKLKSDYRLCLAIHAPRKGIIEVWQMRTGPRLLTIQCAKGSRLLQPTYRLGSRMGPPYVPQEVLLLNGDSGQMSVLNRHLN